MVNKKAVPELILAHGDGGLDFGTKHNVVGDFVGRVRHTALRVRLVCPQPRERGKHAQVLVVYVQAPQTLYAPKLAVRKMQPDGIGNTSLVTECWLEQDVWNEASGGLKGPTAAGFSHTCSYPRRQGKVGRKAPDVPGTNLSAARESSGCCSRMGRCGPF